MERRDHYARKAMLLDLLFRTETRLSALLDPSLFQRLRNRTTARERFAFNTTRRQQGKKLKTLCNKKAQLLKRLPSPITFAPSVKNYSSSTLTNNEMRLLSLGQKFVLPPFDKRATLITDLVV